MGMTWVLDPAQSSERHHKKIPDTGGASYLEDQKLWWSHTTPTKKPEDAHETTREQGAPVEVQKLWWCGDPYSMKAEHIHL